MGYFVEHPGGQRFGPADIQTLNQWISEGRLIATTVLIDAATGAQCYAQDVPGLYFQATTQTTVMPGSPIGTPLGGQPTYSNYPRGPQTPLYQSPGRTSSAITGSYITSGVGVVMICCCPILGVLCGLGGVGLALSARNIDPRGSKFALIFGIVTAVLNIGMGIAGEVLRSMLMGR